MKWRVFDKEESIHVAPVDEDGQMCAPHVQDEFCPCEPVIKQGHGRLIIIHNEEN